MYFIETPIFSKQRQSVLSVDEKYRSLQSALLKCPTQGDVIKGTGGLRKMRWGLEGKGKRGGLRLIYYWHEIREAFLLLYLYPKNELDDLSSTQRRLLAKLVQEKFK